MNFLAHALLSFDDADVLAGNMFSDFVKGKKQYEFSRGIQRGIRLHRLIDEYTDGHAAVREAASCFKHSYRLYAYAFVDVVFDHFLANRVTEFAPYGGLENFTRKTYSLLESYSAVFPAMFSRLFPYMKTQNWLLSYQHIQGTQRSLKGLVNRAVYMHNAQAAMDIFEREYDKLQDCFDEFYPQLKVFAFERYTQLKET